MRTTVDINEPLLRRARVVAIETGRTLGEVVEDALRLALERVEREVAVPPLPVARASALVEGADLSPRGLKELLADEDWDDAGPPMGEPAGLTGRCEPPSRSPRNRLRQPGNILSAVGENFGR